MDLTIKNKSYALPIYLPDATRAVAKSLDSRDLDYAGVSGVVVNTFHLMNQPGTEVLNKLGGVKSFMNYRGLVVSDSGGWQVFSLIHRSKRPGKIMDEGVVFHLDNKTHALFTPEKSIQVQFDIGSDIIICLDDFTAPNADSLEIKASVERTIEWAKRSKVEFDKQLKARKLTDKTRPHLYAVIQGGFDRGLRKYCAEELTKLNFDGYGYGGYAITNGELDLDLSKFVADLIPHDKVKFALGVGTPYQIANCYQYGWQIFDCTLPTRDARHKRLYVYNYEPQTLNDLCSKELYSYIYIDKLKYLEDATPISSICDCHTCKHFTKAYLCHLFKTDVNTAFRLSSIHNIRTYTKLITYLKTLK